MCALHQDISSFNSSVTPGLTKKEMGHVTESIWDGSTIIPLAEVSHIEKLGDLHGRRKRITIIFKHSKWASEISEYSPCVHLDEKSDSDGFLAAWCSYRHELERDTLNLEH